MSPTEEFLLDLLDDDIVYQETPTVFRVLSPSDFFAELDSAYRNGRPVRVRLYPFGYQLRVEIEE